MSSKKHRKKLKRQYLINTLHRVISLHKNDNDKALTPEYIDLLIQSMSNGYIEICIKRIIEQKANHSIEWVGTTNPHIQYIETLKEIERKYPNILYTNGVPPRMTDIHDQ